MLVLPRKKIAWELTFTDSKTSLFLQSGTQGIPMIDINVLSETSNESEHAKATVTACYMEFGKVLGRTCHRRQVAQPSWARKMA